MGDTALEISQESFLTLSTRAFGSRVIILSLVGGKPNPRYYLPKPSITQEVFRNVS